MNKTAICNLALSRIGHGVNNALSDVDTQQGEAAAACRIAFDSSYESLLTEYEWKFSRKIAALALLPQEASGWTHVYALPSDCVYLMDVADETYPFTLEFPHRTMFPFELALSTDGNSTVVLTNQEDAFGYYRAKVEEVASTPNWFQQCLAWRIAMELAMGLKADERKFQVAERGYTVALSHALTINGNQHGRNAAYVPQVIQEIEGTSREVVDGR